MKVSLTLTPPENCPYFEACQQNDCPLDPKPNSYKTLPEDKLLFGFKKCRASKKIRIRIANAFNLKNSGLTTKEIKRNLRREQAKAWEIKNNLFLQGNKNLKTQKNEVLEKDKGVENEN